MIEDVEVEACLSFIGSFRRQEFTVDGGLGIVLDCTTSIHVLYAVYILAHFFHDQATAQPNDALCTRSAAPSFQ